MRILIIIYLIKFNSHNNRFNQYLNRNYKKWIKKKFIKEKFLNQILLILLNYFQPNNN